ncbi:MAG TPA: shikimate dehydrogenase [Actinomycetota bacterium]
MPASGEHGVIRVDGDTKVLGVIGWPVAHSLSPAIHNAAFRALGMHRVYVPLPVRPDGLPHAVQGLLALGFEGANVTMPHKDQSADLADRSSEDARLLHAVNTFVIEGGEVVGENTDRPGFERFLRLDAGFEATGCEALILGAGGAARAVALSLARSGASRITIAVRELDRATAAVELVRGLGVEAESIGFQSAQGRAADLVVNATPLGSDGRSMPPLPALGAGVMVVDLLYHPPQTPWRQAAERGGARTFGGLGLLLHQAAVSFERWTGVEAPMDVMSAAAVHALAGRA